MENRALYAGYRKNRWRFGGYTFGGARIKVGDVIEVTDLENRFPVFVGEVDSITPLYGHYVDGKIVYIAEFGGGHNIGSDNKGISVRVIS